MKVPDFSPYMTCKCGHVFYKVWCENKEAFFKNRWHTFNDEKKKQLTQDYLPLLFIFCDGFDEHAIRDELPEMNQKEISLFNELCVKNGLIAA